jgi:serine protease inhibitor
MREDYLILHHSLFCSKSASDVKVSKFSAMIGDSNRPIGREYEDNVEKIYDVDYIPVNFQDVDNTLRTVNNMISRSTNGQISEAITRDDILKV